MKSSGSYSGNGMKIRREMDIFENYEKIDAFPASG